MSIVAIVGGKHSPGTTTLAVALASTASAGKRALLVEADPAGGDIAARAGMQIDPGLLTLAAAGRRGVTEALMHGHTQRFASGASVLLDPPSPEQAGTALVGLGPSLARVISQREGITFVDIGRWDRTSPATDFVQAADAIVVVFRPTLEGVEHARSRIASLRSFPAQIVATTVGERPYAPTEVAAALDGVDLHVVPHDPRPAAAIASGVRIDRWLAHSALLRSAAALSERLDTGQRALTMR